MNSPSCISRKLSTLAAAILLMLPALVQAQSTWSATTGTWNTAGNWTPTGVPTSATTTQLIFNASGTTSYTTTNDIGSGTFNLNKITVNNTGTGTITVAGSAAANSLTFGGTSATLDITGKVLGSVVLAGSGSITKTGTGTFDQQSNSTFTGTLTINQGTFITSALASGTFNFNPVSIVVNNGGTYQFGVGGVGDPNLPNSTYITVNTGGTVNWIIGETFGGIHLAGGTVDLQAGGTTDSGTTAQAWTSGTLTGSVGITARTLGGTAAINKTTSGTVNVTGNASITTTTGGLNIQDGTIAMAGAGNLGTSNVTLGNTGGTTTGIFEYQGATASRAGTFGVNAGGGTIKVGSSTTTLTLSGNFSGAGALSKTGPGTLALTGTLGGTGTTTANEGTLKVNPVTASGGFAVAAGATLATNSGAGTASFTTPSLNLAANSTLQFELNTAAVSTAPLAVVSNSNGVTLAGTPTLRVTNQQSFANGTYTLLDYSGTSISSGFALSLPGRTAGVLVYDTVNTKIDLTINGTDTVKWTGAVNGNWDVGTAAGVGGTNNWKLVTSGTATNFIDTDSITFDDTATTFAVNLTTTVQPLTTTVNSTTDYTFSGPGKLSGATSLSKSGTGTLTVSTDNDYSGGTAITGGKLVLANATGSGAGAGSVAVNGGGTLQLGNGGAAGSLASSVSLNGATLAFNRSDAYTFSNAVTIAGTAGFTQNGTGVTTISTALVAGTNTVNFDGSGELDLGAAISGTGIINKSGTGSVVLLGANSGFTGTVNINGGTVLVNDLGAGGDLNATSIVVNNGGTYQFGVTGTGNPDHPDTTYVTANTGGTVNWQVSEQLGGLHLNGGTINVQGGITSNGATAQSWTSGTLSGSTTFGGNTAINKTTSGTVNVTGTASITTGTGGLNIQEGTIAMATAANLGTAAVSLGDAAGTTSGTFEYQGVTATRAGAFAVNNGGGTIKVTSSTAVLTLSGAFSGSGPLSKTGSGTLALTGALGSTGTTTASEGTLKVNPVTASGGFAVAANATLATNAGAGTASFTTPSLSLTNGSTLQFDLNTTALPTVPLLVVSNTDGLTSAGTASLKLTNTTTIPAGTYTLIDYSGADITTGFSLAPLAGRAVGSLVYDTANTQIKADISVDSLKWTGTIDSDWNVGSAIGVGGTNNWKLSTAGTATNFINTDNVTFDDTAANHAVNLPGTVLPVSVTANATADYTISGAGKISGGATFFKLGTGTLTLATDNDNTGATSITAGTLQVGSGGATGSLGSGTVDVAAGATLKLNKTGSSTLANTLTGTGTIQLESGTFSQTSNSTGFTGTLIVNGGTFRSENPSGTHNFNASAITVNNGGTYIFGNAAVGNPNLPDTTYITANTGGAIIFDETENFGGVHLLGGSLELRGTDGNISMVGATPNNFQSGTITRTETKNVAGTGVINKTTAGTVTVTGAELNNTGGLNIQEGTLSTDADIGDTGAATLGTATTSATLKLATASTVTYGKALALNNTSLNGSVIEVTNAAAAPIWSGVISGAGALTKTGSGSLILTNANTYAGGTSVSSGTLFVENATGSATGTGAVTVVNGATLAGTGIISAGTNLISIDGVLSVGSSNSTAGTDLHLSTSGAGSTALGAASLLKLDLFTGAGLGDNTATATAADILKVTGNLTLNTGATLALFNPNSLINWAVGDSFKILDWTSVGAVTGTWTVDYSALALGSGLGLDTTNLYSAGTVAVVAVPEPGRLMLVSVGLAALIWRRRR